MLNLVRPSWPLCSPELVIKIDVCNFVYSISSEMDSVTQPHVYFVKTSCFCLYMLESPELLLGGFTLEAFYQCNMQPFLLLKTVYCFAVWFCLVSKAVTVLSNFVSYYWPTLKQKDPNTERFRSARCFRAEVANHFP